MKRNVILYALTATCLLLSGCSQKISAEEAKEIALSHAGLTAEQVTFAKNSLDRDDSPNNYDIEFYTQDQKEYNYEIDSNNGEILEWDVEPVYEGAR